MRECVCMVLCATYNNLLVSLRLGTDSLGCAPLESQRGADCEGKKGNGLERVSPALVDWHV